METTLAVVSHRFLLDHERLEVLLGELLAAVRANDHERESRLWEECRAGLMVHLEAEETHLIPALRRMNERDARVIVQEHHHIRTRLAEIGAGMVSRSVRFDSLRDFIDELRAHAQSEDRLLYKWADTHLDEQQLASAIGALVMP